MSASIGPRRRFFAILTEDSICRVVRLERIARTAGHAGNLANPNRAQSHQPALKHAARKTQRDRQFTRSSLAGTFQVADNALIARIGKELASFDRLRRSRTERRRCDHGRQRTAAHECDRKKGTDAMNHLLVGQRIKAMDVEQTHAMAT